MAAYRRVDGLVTCRLTACTPGSAPGPTLGNEYGKTLPFYVLRTTVRFVRRTAACQWSILLQVRPRTCVGSPACCVPSMTSEPQISSVIVHVERHLVKRRCSALYRRPHRTRPADVFLRRFEIYFRCMCTCARPSATHTHKITI